MRKRPRKATLADKMEAALARLLGWASWPFVEATRESELNVNSLQRAGPLERCFILLLYL